MHVQNVSTDKTILFFFYFFFNFKAKRFENFICQATLFSYPIRNWNFEVELEFSGKSYSSSYE